jgi:hypothetical protein
MSQGLLFDFILPVMSWLNMVASVNFLWPALPSSVVSCLWSAIIIHHASNGLKFEMLLVNIMASTKKIKDEGIPTPNTALKRLSGLVGKWNMTGRPLGAKEDSIKGTTSFKWLHGKEGTSFFLLQKMKMDYAGTAIKSHEIIGYNATTKAFSSNVYSNMAAEPWPYEWNIKGNNITISINYGKMKAKFKGKFSADGNSFSGGWRPNPGADKEINAPYNITAIRLK